MKDNYTIIQENLTVDGSYYIKINTEIGVFEGKTEPDEIDSQYPSIYHAGEIALAKALRQFSKAATNQLKREAKLVDNMMKQVLDNGTCFGKYTAAFKTMNGTLKQITKELNKWEARTQSLTKNILTRIAARDKIVAKYIEKDKVE